MVREYSKTTNIMQADKVIPHAVDAFSADMFIQIHVLARPVAQFLASKLYNPSVALLYGEMAFMDLGKEFTSEGLTSVMSSISLPILDWSLKISSWRHITNAIKRKRCTKTMALLSEDDTFNLHMQQNGHSATVNQNIYATTPISLLGFPEDIIFSYMMVSTEWQRLFHIVPGGIHLPYSQSTSKHYQHLYDTGFLRTKLFPGPQSLGNTSSLQLIDSGVSTHEFHTFFQQQQQRDEVHLNKLAQLEQTLQSLQHDHIETQRQQTQLTNLISTLMPLLSQFTNTGALNPTINTSNIAFAPTSIASSIPPISAPGANWSSDADNEPSSNLYNANMDTMAR
ncbi:hypothetical protein FB446DRAFT_710231 [Lentinula raphanica]|nr:hypothetical protein FB446DRAFT_710231 [Lentinula raphanica]